MFLNIFRKPKLTKAVDVSHIKVDMHSHLIPGIDDGVQSVEEAVKLVGALKEAGFSKIITTPHVMNDTYKNTPEIIKEGLKNLKVALENAHIYIPIEAAAEYLIDDGFEKIFKEGRLLTFGKKYILVELSYYNMYHGFYALVFDLQIAGYQVILAHPERYAYFHDKWSVYEDLKARGILFQLNAISLTGCYSPKVQKVAEKLIELGFYDFAGTDMHNEEYLNNFSKSLYAPPLQKLVDSGLLKNHLL